VAAAACVGSPSAASSAGRSSHVGAVSSSSDLSGARVPSATNCDGGGDREWLKIPERILGTCENRGETTTGCAKNIEKRYILFSDQFLFLNREKIMMVVMTAPADTTMHTCAATARDDWHAIVAKRSAANSTRQLSAPVSTPEDDEEEAEAEADDDDEADDAVENDEDAEAELKLPAGTSVITSMRASTVRNARRSGRACACSRRAGSLASSADPNDEAADSDPDPDPDPEEDADAAGTDEDEDAGCSQSKCSAGTQPPRAHRCRMRHAGSASCLGGTGWERERGVLTMK
jgi:hypothetical protein